MLLGGSLPPIMLPAMQDAEAKAIAAGHFATAFCQTHPCADIDQVWNVLVTLPENILCSLDTPIGWTALAAVVANDLNLAGGTLMPVLH